MKRYVFAAMVAFLALLNTGQTHAQEDGSDYRLRPPQDDVIYFVLPDRFENGDASNDQGGIGGSRLQHGFDPTHKGFYHGGDLKGLTSRLDYIKELGATAIWLGPIYKNNPVQGAPGSESAGYHGYWITDFTEVDPHFGSSEDLKAFVDAAHARGIKVYLDIITNHTADIIKYSDCHGDNRDASYQNDGCPFRGKAEYPYSAKNSTDGGFINKGFLGDAPEFQTAENFEKLVRADFAYAPYVPAGSEKIKKPDWLNDPLYYHNRGDFSLADESSLYGDFSGLDDLFTENPRVVDGFIDIFKQWITNFKLDGFRVDTARHVNPEFWQTFIPAMISHAESEGIPNFYIFGEAYDPDPAGLARFTRKDGFPYVLDFAFQSAVTDVVAKEAPTQRLSRLFFMDALYEGGEATALGLPVFIGNHDMGRFAHFVRKAAPDASPEETLKRAALGHAMMFFLRGAPVIYYGDEQGFVGDGGDQDAREDMFESKVDIYNDNVLIGSKATTADDNFDMKHPLYTAIAGMAKIFRAHQALRRGKQVIRRSELDGGIFAVSRMDAKGGEYLIAFNTRNEQRGLTVEVDSRSASWRSVYGDCAKRSEAPGAYAINLAPLSYVICRSNAWSADQ
ncbi:MAG: alpha-amylase family glycosyl hydrolase [Amphiplicatus sp.]